MMVLAGLQKATLAAPWPEMSTHAVFFSSSRVQGVSIRAAVKSHTTTTNAGIKMTTKVRIYRTTNVRMYMTANVRIFMRFAT